MLQLVILASMVVLLTSIGETQSDEAVDIKSLLAQLQQLQQGQAEMKQANDALKQGQAEVKHENVDLKTELGKVRQLQQDQAEQQINMKQENDDLTTKVQQLQQGQAEVKQENDDPKTKVQQLQQGQTEVKQDNGELKTKVQKLQQGQAEVKRENDELKTEVRQRQNNQPRDVGRPPTECVLGSNFLFNEMPATYGIGMNFPIGSDLNVYRCLDMCIEDPTCLAVSIGHEEPRSCMGYSVEPYVLEPSPVWDYYQMAYTNSCLVDKPVVEFMTSITNSACYNDDELVVWNYEVFDSADSMTTDGRFYCPVAGTYQFSLHVTAYNNGYTYFYIRKNDVTNIGFLDFHTNDGGTYPGSLDVYSYCDVDESVSVWATHDDSCVRGSSLRTTFSGRLV